MAENCIPANPEIAGIGVRVSVYVQAILGFTLAGFALYRYARDYGEAFGEPIKHTDLENIKPSRSEIELLFHSDLPTNDVLKRLHRTYLRDEKEDRRDLRLSRMSLGLTGAALLTAALIQSALYGLDVYHALIVLNLSWLINITIITLYLTEMYLMHPKNSFLKYPFPKRFFTFRGLRESEPFLPTSLFLSGLGGFGLWLFVSTDYFGDDVSCNPTVVYWLFGNQISATNSSFRTAGIVIHAIIAFPGVNVVEEMFLCCRLAMGAQSVINLPHLAYRWFVPTAHLPRHRDEPGSKVSDYRLITTVLAIAMQYVFLSIVFILGTEETIGSNFNHVVVEEGGAGESAWTFGQTLVMLLLLPLVLDLISKTRETMATWKEQKEEDKKVEEAVLRFRRTRSQDGTSPMNDLSLQEKQAISGEMTRAVSRY